MMDRKQSTADIKNKKRMLIFGTLWFCIAAGCFLIVAWKPIMELLRMFHIFVTTPDM
jgi:hypothetical protein